MATILVVAVQPEQRWIGVLLAFENLILRQIAKGEPLEATARTLCSSVERVLPGVICTLLGVDRAGLLRPIAAPSLSAELAGAIDGVMIGPDVGSCGSAAYFRQPVGVDDIEHDPRCARFRTLYLEAGLRACWSRPIFDGQGTTIAVIALYFTEMREPTATEMEIVEACVELCALALDRHVRVEDRERRATLDALTSLPNRAAFDAAMARVPCDHPGLWGLFLIDLDNLKVVNDTFGHQAGDELIRIAAARIAAEMVPDVTFRLGGDEFAVLIQSPAVLKDLNEAAGRVFRSLEQVANCDGHAITPRATIGAAVLDGEEHDALAVVQNADFALYHAKETGRGGFVRYWRGLGTRIADRRKAVREVNAALEEDRIDAFYQPVVNLESAEIVGVEALCRLRQPSGELLPASAFREATWDAHVATALTRRMLEIIANDARSWCEAGTLPKAIGLNLAVADFYTGGVLDLIKSSLGAAGVPLSRLVVEVSEEVYLGQRDRVIAREIALLRENGVHVALDRFGTGHASLTPLATMPVDIIKIDRSFVAGIREDHASRVIVEGLIGIAAKLGIMVVAEGVETREQAGELWSIGCRLGQGFLFSPAMDRQEISRSLHEGVLRDWTEPKRLAAAFERLRAAPTSQDIKVAAG